MKNRIIAFTLFVFAVLAPFAVCASAELTELTLPRLMAGIVEYEKKEVLLTGTIAGACNSGCKLWVSDGAYKEGAPVALVWAKDKAFTFKTDATGQKVVLRGYAVGKYIDLCAIEKAANGNDDDKKEEGCNPVIETEDGKKQLSSITFFATSVEYL